MKSIGVTLQRTYLTRNCKKKHCATSTLVNGINFRSSRPEMFCKESVLRNFAKLTCAKVSFLKKLQTPETSTQVFSCEIFAKFLRTLFFYRTTPLDDCFWTLQRITDVEWYKTSIVSTYLKELFPMEIFCY